MGEKARKLVIDVESRLKELAEETDEVKQSEEFQKFVEVMSKFHKYSFHNQMLIMIQNPDATLVAGYRAWQEMGRQVQKGEKSIKILAPGQSKRVEADDNGDETEKLVRYFFSVSVFDISQTEGDPLPIPDHRVTGDTWQPFLDALLVLCKEKGIAVDFTKMGWGIGGVSSGGKIEINADRTVNEQVATTIHEVAHEILHREDRTISSNQREIEAESVTHVVLTHFGLESKSGVYIASYEGDYEMMKVSMRSISKAVKEIVGSLIESLETEQKAAA